MAVGGNMDNDTRGWVMTCISGIACILGAAFICVDLLIRLVSRNKQFRIQDSDGFLSCSLSLSAGVMLFSSLYSMLPNAKTSLQNGGHNASSASWIMIACFLVGVFGIQIFSNICHRFIPHRAVDCDHSHDDGKGCQDSERKRGSTSRDEESQIGGQGHYTTSNEHTPLLLRSQTSGVLRPHSDGDLQADDSIIRPPLPSRVTTQVSRLVAATKPRCDADGHCYGWSDPCSQDCFRNIHAKGGSRVPLNISSLKSSSHSVSQELESRDEPTSTSPLTNSDFLDDHSNDHDDPRHYGEHNHGRDHSKQGPNPHHHHVPQNAFLSISLQTSIAIALHKLPEGFITYATNHANPTLGVTVFLALFIHNITEGFALALPIFLATQSRIKAMLLTLVLGGLSQPAGAGFAALWLKLAEGKAGQGQGTERGNVNIDPAVYGAMFAITAGIMASVAVSLLSESFELTHSRNLCMVFCFVGMGILGCSTALTAA